MSRRLFRWIDERRHCGARPRRDAQLFRIFQAAL
jgi:hypothetical protein